MALSFSHYQASAIDNALDVSEELSAEEPNNPAIDELLVNEDYDYDPLHLEDLDAGLDDGLLHVNEASNNKKVGI